MARKRKQAASLFDEAPLPTADPNESLVGFVVGEWKVLRTWQINPAYVEVGRVVRGRLDRTSLSVRRATDVRKTKELSE